MLTRVKDIPAEPVDGVCYLKCGERAFSVEIESPGDYSGAKSGDVIDVSHYPEADSIFEAYEDLVIRLLGHPEV